MSSTVGEVLIGIFSGVVGGALSGGAIVLFQRRLMRRGDITSEFGTFRCSYRSGRKSDGEGGYVDEYIEPTDTAIDGATYFEYSFDAKLYNDKDVSTLLRDVAVVFRSNRQEKFVSKPENVSSISLPSRVKVHVDVAGVVQGSDLDYLVMGCDEARLQAKPSTRDTFDKHVANIRTTYCNA